MNFVFETSQEMQKARQAVAKVAKPAKQEHSSPDAEPTFSNSSNFSNPTELSIVLDVAGDFYLNSPSGQGSFPIELSTAERLLIGGVLDEGE